MNSKDLKEYLLNEETKAFSGWDFSYLKGRWDSEALQWDYKNKIKQYLRATDSLLDMGTGGGEFLLTLNHPFELTSVTEAYPPNVKLCEEKLSPLGITVKQVSDDDNLPFEADTFDIIINRHEAFNINEVGRILKNGGYFITQQVGGKNDNDLSYKVIDNFVPQFPNHNLKHNIEELQKVGFDILGSDEVFTPVNFYDLGALVYFAKIIEWEFPGFSVERCFDNLFKLQKELHETGEICGTEHRFIIIARRK